MLTNIEAGWVPFPEGAAERADVLPCFQLLDLLRFVALVFFPISTEVVFISVVVVIPLSGCVVALPLFLVAAAIATLPMATPVCLTCIACGLIALHRMVAHREAGSLLLSGWLSVAHDLFQKAVDVVLYRDGSLFNIRDT